jgi:hypothetical protein
MNPNQLATLDEAKAIAAKLGSIGGGVADIYIPEYFGPFAAPEQGDRKFYHFKFKNGADGFNVGLIRTTMQYSPSRWLMMIATEVNTAIPWAS